MHQSYLPRALAESVVTDLTTKDVQRPVAEALVIPMSSMLRRFSMFGGRDPHEPGLWVGQELGNGLMALDHDVFQHLQRRVGPPPKTCAKSGWLPGEEAGEGWASWSLKEAWSGTKYCKKVGLDIDGGGGPG